MAKYQVLRDCYCEERFFYGDSIMDLADGLNKKYPKNFKLLEESDVAEAPVPESQRPPKPMAVADVPKETPFFRENTPSQIDWDKVEVYVSDKDKIAKSNESKTGKTSKRGK